MIALDYNKLVTIPGVTSLKSTHGILNISAPFFTYASQLTSASYRQLHFCVAVR